MLVVDVPVSRQQEFLKESAEFFDKSGLPATAGQIRALGERGSSSRQSDQIIACNWKQLVWLGNSIKPDMYIVTFHRNSLFGSGDPKLYLDFAKAFSKKYRLRVNETGEFPF